MDRAVKVFNRDSFEIYDQKIRSQALSRLQQKHHFRVAFLFSSIGMILLVIIWVTSEYHNAGGWPTQGFSQSSAIPHVWNIWIVYPIIGWLIIIGGLAWSVYGDKPISEHEIAEEIKRQSSNRST